MRTRPIAFLLALVILGLLFLPQNRAPNLVFALPDRSWSRTLTVPAGGERNAVGGIDFAKNIEVYGTVSVRSCCGFSTNDIDLFVRGADDFTGSRGFGVIVGNFSFEWNSGENDSYEVIFDNKWIVCEGTPLVCAGGETSPSYHDKTVDLTLREVAPLGPYLLNLLPFLTPALALIGIVTVGFVIVHLRGRARDRQEKAGSRSAL